MRSRELNRIYLLSFVAASCFGNVPVPDNSVDAYFGCYSDIGSDATFINVRKNMENLTPTVCRERCKNEGSSYIGLWGGANCWCSVYINTKTHLKKVHDSNCNASCSGNTSLSCGGFQDTSGSLFSVYSVCSKGEYGRQCIEICNCRNNVHCSIQGVCPDNQCADGWTTGITTSGRKICNTDLNECQTNVSVCEHLCHNTLGGYECRCPVGYELNTDNRTCRDKDECNRSESSCQQLCNNTVGDYSCYCRSGFKIDATNESNCNDIDECSFNNSNCEHSCSNTIGSYFCSCKEDFELDADNFSCQKASFASFIKKYFIHGISGIAAIGLIFIILIITILCRRSRRLAKERERYEASKMEISEPYRSTKNPYSGTNYDGDQDDGGIYADIL